MFKENNKIPRLNTVNNTNKDLLAIDDMYNFINQEKYVKSRNNKYNLMTGDPLNFKPYKFCIKEAKKTLNCKCLFEYQQTSGSISDKTTIVEYLKNIGFSDTKINPENCIFTYSTTHAYNLIFETLAKKGDAIIIPKPNYGFFDFMPARYGLNVLTIDLECEDNWLVNPQKLESVINNFNSNNKQCGKVKFFYNCNPHNPTGKVMGVNEVDIIKKISLLAKKYNFYIIDDLVYRDICFNKYYPVPVAKYAFENTMSLLGLSKCYGLASLRSGILVANQKIIKLVNDKIFHTVDSISTLNIALTKGAFNTFHKHYRRKYFDSLNKRYRKKFDLLQKLIYGSKDATYRKKIKKILGCKKAKLLYEGIREIKFIEKLEKIDSGFFALINFSYFKNKSFSSTMIKTEYDLFDVLYNFAHIKLICGTSIMWPNKNMFVGRINFAVSDSDLVNSFYELKKLINNIN